MITLSRQDNEAVLLEFDLAVVVEPEEPGTSQNIVNERPVHPDDGKLVPGRHLADGKGVHRNFEGCQQALKDVSAAKTSMSSFVSISTPPRARSDRGQAGVERDLQGRLARFPESWQSR